MKLSEKWLREWINPPLTREQLIDQLTMIGIAVESCMPVETGDHIIEFELTANRGDCLSLLGIAREVSAMTGVPINMPQLQSVVAHPGLTFPINIHAVADCPRYVGRVIKDINLHAKTPDWMQERLEHSGIKTTFPIVDVMNYVMLELGQPLHAFDLAHIQHEIIVRRARQGELITVLDGRTITLSNDVLVIADDKQAHAVAGIMGGANSAVNPNTKDIFIESAFFMPEIIAGRARRYALHTDASHRFERGVDPELPIKAIERASELLLQIVGGKAGVVQEKNAPEFLISRSPIVLRQNRISQVLGILLSEEDINTILQRLNMSVTKHKDAWHVAAPSYRFDINQEIDLVEEVARLHGYQHLPAKQHCLPLQTILPQEEVLTLPKIRQLFVDQGYHEVITYSFISADKQRLFDPEISGLELANPLSAELAVMRTNLWPGLLQIVQHNLNRQQAQFRFFETGMRFVPSPKSLQQETVLSGVLVGDAFPEQWSSLKRNVDFFDMKGDLQRLFAMTGNGSSYYFKTAERSALHPTQSAAIYRNQHIIGWCGALHPQLQKEFDLENPVYLFEITLSAVTHAKIPVFNSVPKFPSIRRDIAVVVRQDITAYSIQEVIRSVAGNLLVDHCIFDQYQGKNIPVGKKSLALGLIFQAVDRTLIETEVNDLMAKIIEKLKQQFGLTLRE